MIRKSYMASDMTVMDGERAVVAKICVPVVDRDGEVVMPQGCVSIDFEKNPVVFYAHSYQVAGMESLPPVARCASLKRGNDWLLTKTIFAARPDNHPPAAEWLPDTLFSLYQQGVLNGFSVGFNPIASRAATKGDKELYGPDCKRVYSKWNMLEYSVAPIPCNQDALVLAVSKGIITAERIKTMFGVDLPAPTPIIIEVPKVIPPPIRKVSVVYHQRPEPAPAIDTERIIKRFVDKRCGVLYTD